MKDEKQGRTFWDFASENPELGYLLILMAIIMTGLSILAISGKLN